MEWMDSQEEPPLQKTIHCSGDGTFAACGLFLAAPAERGEIRQALGKSVAAGQVQPALLHLEIILNRRRAQAGFGQPLAFLRTADRRPIERLVNKGFVERHTLNSQQEEYVLTAIGKKVLDNK
jgi:hypothetical protein